MDRFKPTREQLYQWYVVENLTAVEIAEQTGYNRSRIFVFLDEYGIPRNKRVVVEARQIPREKPQARPYTLTQPTEGSTYHKIPGKEWLETRYWEDNLNVTDIAKELGVNPNSVTKALHKYNIPIKPKFMCYEGRSQGRGDFSKSLRTRIMNRDGSQCRMCGSVATLEVHHIVPLRLGGVTCVDNGITLCSSCHTKIGFCEINYIGHLLQARGSYNTE